MLEQSTEGNYQQTFEFGEVMRRAIPRTRVLRLMALKNGQPVGVVQATYRSRWGFGGNLQVGGISGGAPLVCANTEEERAFIVRALLKSLEEHAVKRRILRARVYWTEDWGLGEVFQQLGYTLRSDVNAFIVDLPREPEELWRRISHNFRRKVKQARKAGVEVVEAKSRENLPAFYRLVKEAGERHGFNPPPLTEFEAVWEIFRPKGRAWIFLAEWNGKPVAGVQVIAHRKTLQATSAGSLKEAWRARPNDYLHWKVMEWACQQGFSYYHLGGALSPGLIRWKKQFRGRQVKVCKYDKVLLPRLERTLGRMYGALATARNALKRVLR